MKKILLPSIALVAILSFNSCKKCECVCPPPPPCNNPCDTVKVNWKGSYTSLSSSSNTVDNSFINDGIARLNNSPFSYYWTSIDLNIPACKNLTGDSIKFEISARNPLSEGAIEELDLSLVLEGEQSTANVTFIGRSHRQQFTSLKVGTVGVSDVPELVQLFQDWTNIVLEAKGNKLSVYKNSVLVKSINYAGTSIGKLKKIAVSFKGVGSLDWVRLSNSSSGTLKMQETFNTNNQATVQWY
jgi:hypothetical protein